MATRNEVTVTIHPPIERVFGFLADGENDKLFSERIIEIAKTTDGDTGVGTVYVSTARDMGRKAKHEVEITVFEPRPASAGASCRRALSSSARAATTSSPQAPEPS